MAIVERQNGKGRALFVVWRDRAGKQHWTKVDGRSVELRPEEREHGRKAAGRLEAAIKLSVASCGTWPDPRSVRREGGTTFDEFAADWLERTKRRVDVRTYGNYAAAFRLHLSPTLGTFPLANVRRRHVLDLFEQMASTGKALNTQRNALIPLRAMLNDAIDREEIETNPALRIELHGAVREGRAPSPAELAAILSHARPDAREAIAVAAALGLRRGELFALRWSDIDFQDKVLVVHSTNHRAHVKANTKTKAGTRVVPLFRRPRAILERRRRRLDPRLTTAASFVFSNASGGPVDPGNFARREWVPACKAAGVSYHFHDLRHYGATALDEEGMAGKLRTEIVGHASEKITNGIYTHVRRSRISQAAGEFDPLRGVC
jgi:integrase